MFMYTMRASACRNLILIVLISFIGFDTTNSLWIPIPRGPKALSQLVRRLQRPSGSTGEVSMPVAAKRDLELVGPSGPIGNGMGYTNETPMGDGNRHQQTPMENEDDHEFSIEKHWPVTPRACLVLMKILQAQTAEIIEQGETEVDFYEAASYYQPAIRTLSKCMEMADRGYENVILE